MSSSYSGNPAGPIVTTFTIPSDGDPVNAASVNTVFQPLADDVAFLGKGNLYGNTRILDSVWFISGNTAGLFSFIVPASGEATVPLHEIPNGATVTSVSVKVSPAVHANLPGSMPTLSFISVTAAGAGTLQTVTDPSPNTTVYNATHSITLTLSPAVTIDRTSHLYCLTFVQETGANSADGTVVTATVTVN